MVSGIDARALIYITNRWRSRRRWIHEIKNMKILQAISCATKVKLLVLYSSKLTTKSWCKKEIHIYTYPHLLRRHPKDSQYIYPKPTDIIPVHVVSGGEKHFALQLLSLDENAVCGLWGCGTGISWEGCILLSSESVHARLLIVQPHVVWRYHCTEEEADNTDSSALPDNLAIRASYKTKKRKCEEISFINMREQFPATGSQTLMVDDAQWEGCLWWWLCWPHI